ncbi:cysteine desulfurase [Micromonospora qiuiae]|uniref:cysteine desulfurase n=1 Tax=Micromonospora qiuiae TaxID=502268 RepID=A0ABQ4JG13_9ACTN|nr:cysteine desulfurase [Micromonospora qiuiae]GIJ29211.1 cysteine desulfurase [Micromonospora qiuiae]
MNNTMNLPVDEHTANDEWARKVRAEFPFFQQPDVEPIVYIDNGATTQMPRSVIDAMANYYATSNSNGGRGMYRLSLTSTELHHRARERTAGFIGADVDEIVFTKNATESVNLVARTFGKSVVGAGDEVLITGMEHHSNMLPWRQLCERVGARLVVVPAADGVPVSPEEFECHLSPRTKMAAITHISNVLGTVNPVAELVEVAHRHGVPVLIDGAQAISRRPVDVRAIGADFYAFSAHKMYGPAGVGILYAKRKHLTQMPMHHLGGGSVLDASYDRDLLLMPAPYRFEPGTPNIAGAVGLAAAIDFLDSLGWDSIVEHDAALAVAAAIGLSAVDGVRVLGDPVRNKGGIVSFVVEGMHPYDVGNHLNEHNVAVRTGVHCAIPLVDSLDVVGTVRASFGVYNTMADVESLISAIRTASPGMWTTDYPNERLLPEHKA